MPTAPVIPLPPADVPTARAEAAELLQQACNTLEAALAALRVGQQSLALERIGRVVSLLAQRHRTLRIVAAERLMVKHAG